MSWKRSWRRTIAKRDEEGEEEEVVQQMKKKVKRGERGMGRGTKEKLLVRRREKGEVAMRMFVMVTMMRARKGG